MSAPPGQAWGGQMTVVFLRLSLEAALSQGSAVRSPRFYLKFVSKL